MTLKLTEYSPFDNAGLPSMPECIAWVEENCSDPAERQRQRSKAVSFALLQRVIDADRNANELLDKVCAMLQQQCPSACSSSRLVAAIQQLKTETLLPTA